MSQPPSSDLDLNNIQGDILGGFPKKTETWYFFQITKVEEFRKRIAKLVPLIKTVKQVLKDREDIEKHKRDEENPRQTEATASQGNKLHLIPMVGMNLAFSHFGFNKMGINDAKLSDTAFLAGQRVDAGENLGDKGTETGQEFNPDWEPAFKNEIHGVFVIAGDSHASVNKKLAEVQQILGVGTPESTILEITKIAGDTRPGDLSAHEHFGFLDGVSNPAVLGFDKKLRPGPPPVEPGVILLGHKNDPVPERDPWMLDGSFLVFRKLKQRVPEFDLFVETESKKIPQMSPDLFGARMVGRWKSGAPIDLVPFVDSQEIAEDPDRNNDFNFSAERDFQKICPFAAHVRKTLPRADLTKLGFPIESRRIIRRGIQFGPEVTKQEKRERRTIHDRGLLFACYQSSITNGFQFIQKSWSNNPNFPPGEQTEEVPGFDPIIGQGENREMSGIDPNNPKTVLKLPEPWVVPRGGEYFFSPSLKGLRETIALTGLN